MSEYLMGIDNGGSQIKAAIFDLKGNEVAVASLDVPMDIPKPGFTERDPKAVWEGNAKVIKEALSMVDLTGEDIAGIGLTGYGNGMVLVDENGEAVYPVIVSTDSRATQYCDIFEKDGTERKIFPYTRQTTWSAQPAVMLPWFRDNNPEVLKNTRWILGIKDFIRFHLTGVFATEITEASSECLVDLDTRKFEPKLFEYLGISDCYEKEPEIFECTEVTGYVTAKAAKETGLKEGTPVAAGYFDIDANAFASGILDEDTLCLIAGTWSINEFICKEASNDIDNFKNTATLSYLKDYYIIEDSSPTSASNFNWFIKNFLKADRPDVKSSVIYDECNKLVCEIEPKDSEVIFVPYLFDSATNANARGAFLNLSSADDRGAMIRALYEGVVFSSAYHVGNLNRPISSYEKARLSGGVSNSDVWTQMMSDVLQIRVETLKAKETGALGAAMGAGIACGLFKDEAEAIDKMVQYGKVFTPNPEYKEIYEKKFERYKAALEAVDLLAERIY